MRTSDYRQLYRYQRGASMAEYILIVTLVAIGLIVAFSMFSDSLRGKFFGAGSDIKNVEQASGSSYVGNTATTNTSAATTSGVAPVTGGGAVPQSSGSAVQAPPSTGVTSSTSPQMNVYSDPDIEAHKAQKASKHGAPKSYSQTELHTLYGDEKAFEMELRRQRWNDIIRYLILGISVVVLIGLLIVTYMRVRDMIKQMKHQ